MKALRIATVLPIMGLLVSCGGGGGGGGGGVGGGGGGGVVRPTTFTSFSNMTPGQKVQANGISQTINVTFNSAGVTAKTINAPDSANSSVVLSYATSAPLALIGIDVNTPTSSASFLNGRSGETVGCSMGICGALNAPPGSATSGAIAVDPFAMGWNYQTFGYWQSQLSTTTGDGGAISIGSVTPVSGIPISGTATYNGVSEGIYIDTSGIDRVHSASMTAMVDFAARNVSISTANTTLVTTNIAAPQLDYSGVLTYGPGTNQFSGPVSTTSMNGTATGRFYGPAAEEIGGIYSLSGSGPVESMIGGFGGKR